MDVNASWSDLVPLTANIATAITGKEIEASLAKKIEKRGALRGSATKLSNKVSETSESSKRSHLWTNWWLDNKVAVELRWRCTGEYWNWHWRERFSGNWFEHNREQNGRCTWIIVANALSTITTTTTTDASSTAKSCLLVSWFMLTQNHSKTTQTGSKNV